MIFKREYSLNRVRDRITIREGGETLSLYVDCDANSIVPKLLNAERKIKELTKDAEATETDRENAARSFSEAIFGKEQTQALIDFYHNDYGCVVTICGMYFGDNKHGLCKKITKAQKKHL